MAGTDRATVSGALLGPPGNDQPSGLAYAPEVKGHEDQQKGGKDGRVDGVKVGQSSRSDLGPALNQPLEPEPDPGNVFQHAGADGDRPEGKLVPGQQIPGEIGEKHDEKKTGTDDPVELAGRVKGSREEHTEQMQKGHKDEGIRAPVVNVPDQPSEQDIPLKMKDGLIGLFRNGLVNELQENARPQKQENQHNRHAPQPPGEGPSKRVFRNVSRPKMKNQGVEEPSIALPILFCPSMCLEKWNSGYAERGWAGLAFRLAAA